MKRISLLFVFLFLFSVIAIAQQKKYLSYTVKNGETLKSIAKTYHITSRDLLKLNPDMGKNIKENTVIIVPNLEYGKTEVKVANSNKKTYFVLPKETLYGISKMFGITIEQLVAENPQIAAGLEPGMELIIPTAGRNISQKNDSINYEYHKVIKDDTIYNLSNKYHVSQSELLRLNPELSEGLKLGMILKIKPLQNGAIEKNVAIDNGVVEVAGHFTENLDFSKEINLVMLLPYHLNTMSDSTRIENFSKSNSLLTIATDFHLGSLIAIDSLRNRGLKINVKFIDSEDSTQKLQSHINKNSFKSVDVVIGPFFFDNALWLSTHIDSPVIAPFYSKSQAANSNGNLVKSAPENELLEIELLNYYAQQYRGENIIVINDGKSDSQSALWRILSKLKTFKNVPSVSVIKSDYGYISSSKFAEKLKKSENNWVFLVSDEMVTTASSVNSLKGLADNYNITLIAFDKGKNFDSIDNNLLGQLNFVFPAVDYINVDDVNVNYFYKTYQDKNYAIPSKYALKGFDITYDALVRIATKNSLDLGLGAGKSTRISTMFNYHKNLLGSSENKGIFIIQYNRDLSSVILNN